MRSDDRISGSMSAHDTVASSEARRDAVSPIPYLLCGVDLIDLESERKIMRLLQQQNGIAND